jgi:hypothetical protein
MVRDRFGSLVDEIVAWFRPLSPYKSQLDLLEIEKENLQNGVPEPLYFIGMSSKRYVLYNRLRDGTHRIRKFSSHDAGTWTAPKDYGSPSDVPEPVGDVFDLGGERWLCDLWCDAIRQIESGQTRVQLQSAGLEVAGYSSGAARLRQARAR